MKINFPCDSCYRKNCTEHKNCPEWIGWFTYSWKDAVRRIKGKKRLKTDFEI